MAAVGAGVEAGVGGFFGTSTAVILVLFILITIIGRANRADVVGW
jgi:uncharacterized protein (TIGR01732 family)